MRHRRDLRLLLAELQGLVTSDDVQNIPVALNATLTREETLVAALEREQIAERLSAALDGATAAANSVTTSVEGVPALVGQIQAVAAQGRNA